MSEPPGAVGSRPVLRGGLLWVAVATGLAACQGPLSQTTAPPGATQQRTEASLPQFLRDPVHQLQHADPAQRARAAQQLGKLGAAARAAVPALMDGLTDEAPVVLSRYVGGGFYSQQETTPAAEAAKALARIGGPAGAALIEALHHPEPSARRYAVKALGMLGAMDAIEPLLQTLDDPRPEVRVAAAIALSRYRHPRAARTLLDRLPRVSASVQAEIVYALARINDPSVARELSPYARHHDADLRAAVAYALGRLHDRRSRKTLVRLLGDADEIVRANAAFALGSYGGKTTIALLIDRLEDPSPKVRDSAAQALFELTGKDFADSASRWRQWWRQQGLATDVPSTTAYPRTPPN